MKHFIARHPEKLALALSLALLATFLIVPKSAPPSLATADVEREAGRSHRDLAAPPLSPHHGAELIEPWDPPATPEPASDWAMTCRTKGIGIPEPPPPIQRRVPGTVEVSAVEVTPLRLKISWRIIPPKLAKDEVEAPITRLFLVTKDGNRSLDPKKGSIEIEVQPRSHHEFHILPWFDEKEGVATESFTVRIPDKWRPTILLADTSNGLVRIRLEEYTDKGWTPVSEKNYRAGDPIGASGRSVVAIRKASQSRTQLRCDGRRHFLGQTVSWKSKEIELDAGDLRRDPAPAWTRDRLCKDCDEFLQGIRRASRLPW